MFKKFGLRKLAALSVVASVLLAPAASAHSRLISSNPKSGAVVKTLPKSVLLTFNEKLMVINKINPSKVTVTDSSGVQIDNKDSAVRAMTLLVSLKGAAKSGKIRVKYHVVSEDGHPIDGTFTFTLA